MSQQGMTIVSLEGIDVGDLEFIQGKVLAGDYFQESGDISTVNDTIEFIVPSGKTAFLIEAKITIPVNSNSAAVNSATQQTVNDQTVADLKIDTVVKDKVKIGVGSRGMAANNAAAGRGGNGISFLSTDHFNVLGLSLVGDGIKKIEIENVDDDGNAFATMSGYVVTT